MKQIFCITTLLLVFSLWSTAIVEGAEWLGEYVGSEIPEYEIVKSNLYTFEAGGVMGVMSLLDLKKNLAERCKKDGGQAIVNVRFIMFVWEKIGKFIQDAHGDCVYEVKPKK